MPSILTNTRYQAFATAGLVIGFMLAGLWFGIRPNAADAGTFGDVLKAFARETQTKTIVTFILIDVVTGVIAALRVGTFDGQRFAAFMGSNVLPYLFGYMLFWFVSYFGLTDVLTPELAATLSNFGFGAVMSSLAMSIVDNTTRARVGSTPPADVHEFTAANVNVNNTQG
jgi:hypothetical protein